MLRDGRRHIAAFYLAGEFFGYDGNDRRALSAEAISNAKILVIKRSVLTVLAEHDKDIAGRLSDITSGELARTQGCVTLLIKTSSERVADFLLNIADRSPKTKNIELLMSRAEIANHLGLRVETVSRTFVKFEAINAIARLGVRHVKVRDRTALERIAAASV